MFSFSLFSTLFFSPVLTNGAWRWRCEGLPVPPHVYFLPVQAVGSRALSALPASLSALCLGCDTITELSPPPDNSLSSLSLFFFYEPLFLPNNKQPLKRGLMWLLLPPLTAIVLLFVHRSHSSP